MARNCWDVMNCPEERMKACPAFTRNKGHDCWTVTGTLCNGEVQGTMVEKYYECRQCTGFRLANQVRFGIGARLFAGFGVMVALALLIGGIAFSQMKAIDRSYEELVIALVVIVTVSVALGVAIHLTRSLVNPLRVLEEAAVKVALCDVTGDLLQVRGKDEIGRLTMAFNQITASTRDIVMQLRGKAAVLDVAAGQLVQSSQQTSMAATENASTLNQISSTLETATNSVVEVAAVAAAAAGQARDGSRGLDRLIGQMRNISVSSADAQRVIQSLNAKTGNVTRIVDLITRIADEINLLALNAAIEAARAGKEGLGFAVVADEVRNLAGQSAGAAEEIHTLINEVRVETTRAVASMDEGNRQVGAGNAIVREVGRGLQSIIEAAQVLSGQIQDVAAAAQEMSAAVQNVAASTEEQTAAMEGLTSSVLSLSQILTELKEMTGWFKV